MQTTELERTDLSWIELPATWRYVQKTDERESTFWLSKDDELFLHRSGGIHAENRYFGPTDEISYETPTGARLFRSRRSILCVLSPRGGKAWFTHDGMDWHELVPTDAASLGWLSRFELFLRRLINRI